MNLRIGRWAGHWLACLALLGPVLADPGWIDPGFDSGTSPVGTQPDTIAGGTVQADGSVILLRGGFPYALGPGRIFRLFPDGRLDHQFSLDPLLRFEGTPELITEMSPGRLFLTGNNQPFGRGWGTVVALNYNGRWLTNYPADRLKPRWNSALVPLPDGGILLGHRFTAVVNTDPDPPLVEQLDSQGRPVSTFRTNLRGAGNIVGLSRLADGRILVAGTFREPGTSRLRTLGRLLPDGTWDESFAQPNDWEELTISGMWPTDNGGPFLALQARLRGIPRLLRLPASGEVRDASDLWEGFPNLTRINAVLSDRDGVWVGGTHLVRLRSDGQPDTTVATPQLERPDGSSITVLLHLLDGSLVVGGNLSGVVLSPGEVLKRPGYFRMRPDGTIDLNYGRQGFVNAVPTSPPRMFFLLPLRDGGFLAGGSWARFQGAPAGSLCRITAEGTRDSSFPLDRIRLSGQLTAAEFGDEGFLVGSTLNQQVEGQTPAPIIRVRPGGTFETVPELAGSVLALERMADGSVVVAGRFGADIQSQGPTLRRFGADGALDRKWSLDLGIPAGYRNTGILLRAQTGNRLLVGVKFTGEVRRFLADGTEDPEFEPALPLSRWENALKDLAVGDDGSVLAVGNLQTTVIGSQVNALKWNRAGRRDALFESAIRGDPLDVEPAPLGRFVVSGSITRAVVRILPDGALDPTFKTQTNVIRFERLAAQNGGVYGLASLSGFNTGATENYRFVRLQNEAYSLAPPEPTPNGVRLRLVAAAGESHVVEASYNLKDWSQVAALVMPTNRVVEWLLPPQLNQNVQFFRDRRLE